MRTDSSYSILARIVAATQVDTIVHSHLIVDSTQRERPHAARDQRHRHDEPARGGGRVGQPGAQGRAQELRRSCTARARADPYFFREEMTRTSPPATERRAVAARGRGVPARLRRRQPARDGHAAAIRERARRRPRHAVRARAAAAGRARDPRLRSARAVRAPGRRRRRAHVRDQQRRSRRLQRGRRRQHAVERGVHASSASRAFRSRRGSPNLAAEPLRRLRLWDLPPEALQLLRFGRTIDNAPLPSRRASATSTRTRARSRRSRGACASRKTIGDKNPTYRYEREVEDFFRHSPAVIRND